MPYLFQPVQVRVIYRLQPRNGPVKIYAQNYLQAPAE